ncbi:NACHT domain-containing protein [Bacillus sp. WLY-B-L8]|uniref:NACHT domain-containing protein n=1 Tax=Bacillus multifaciens TaxID=3068506 RepID=UPI002741C099|nr:hypothetical protein [Bacillus sp. WLY-B-L8]MDP7981250.1 hypothetical protein [Bacillus sp. WLY-B-L8]
MNYSWNRYWYEREETILLDYDGFVANPKDNKEQKLVTFDSISDKECLILLGGPGIGKSNTLRNEYDKLKLQLATTTNKTDKVEFVDLRDIYNRGELEEDLFKRSFFCEWVNGTDHLYLFLDSFDESLIQYKALTSMLLRKFREYKSILHRLTLRIASRTGLWVSELEEGLKELWGKESFGVYQLSLLCKEDIIHALNINNILSEDFLKEIKAKNLISFTGTPVTLQMLIESYRQGEGMLPNSRISIYKQGCSYLSSEVNPQRSIKTPQDGRLGEIERLNLIKKIATITLFCNKGIVNTSSILGAVPKYEISFTEIGSLKDWVSMEDVNEVLRTGLFVARGTNKYGWAHLTYAEFLAASFVNEYLNNDQIMNLLIHPNDTEGKLIPQLHATAAWIAGMNLILRQDNRHRFLPRFRLVIFIKKFK